MSSASSLENIFFECLQKDSPAERAAYLARACVGDPELLRRVQKMLQAQGSSFLEQAAYVPDLGAEAGTSPDRSGQFIGAYRLVEQIGEGGMGTVWRAEQKEPVQRQVAIKLVKTGMDSQQVIARFEAERQALALMDHPNIARVLDGGTDGAGRPYFVMDLLVGVPITSYCDEQQLTVRQRLALFVPVCEAVQHAHQKGVIHRDIKPANVMVTVVDGRAIPKVIDFGIAKAIAPGPGEHTCLTQHGSFLGTFEYMSPEQAAGSAGGVDTRSDIFSLGALLYELLTGTTPLARQSIDQASYRDILRAITDAETEKPSTRLEAGDAIATIAAQRRVAPARLANLVRGELDWIVMKALERDRDHRYATAAAFAQDVQRFLADEPVLACPPSTVYLLRKFVRRHRAALAAAGVLLTASLVAIGGVGWAVRDRAAQTAEAERARTDRQARVAATVQELLAAADRQMAAQAFAEALTTVRRADAAATSGEAAAAVAGRVRDLRRGLELVQRLEHIRSVLATWNAAGVFNSTAGVRDYDRAFRDHGIDIEADAVETTIERLQAIPALAVPLAAGLAEWAVRTRDLTRWQRLIAVANAVDPQPLRSLIRSAAAKPGPATAAELQRLAATIDLREEHPSTLVHLAWSLQQNDRRAEELQLLRAAQFVHPGDFWLNFELGAALDKAKEGEGAIRYYTAAVAIRPDSAGVHSNLGNVLRRRRDLDAAVACLRRAIELDPDLAVAHANLGVTLADQKKPEEALASLRRAIDLAPNWAFAWSSLGSVLLEQKQWDDALDACHRAIALEPKNVHARVALSNVRRALGELDEALVAARQAIASDPDCADGHLALGNALGDQGHLAASIAAFRKVIELDPLCAIAYANLGSCLGSDPARIGEAIAMSRRAIEIAPGYALGHLSLGNALFAERQADAAIVAYSQAIDLDPSVAAAHFNLGQVLASQKRTDEAIAAYRKAIWLSPNYKEAHFRLGVALASQKRADEAIAAYRGAVAVDPKYADAHFNLGLLHHGRGEWHEAVAALSTFIDLDPRNADANFILGLALTELGERDEAVAAHRRATEIDPGNATRHLFLGTSLQGLGRLDEAVAAYRKAIAVDPKNALLYGVLGDVLHMQHQEGEAESAYRSAIAANPDFRGAYHGLGTALRSQGKWAEAIAAFETSARIGPISAGLASELAWLLANCPDPTLRDGSRSVELARQAVDLEPNHGRNLRVLGAALYRAGNWLDALDELLRATDLEPDGSDFDGFFAAMAHWQLGAREAARSSYTKATETMERTHAGDDDLRRLRAEAAGLLGVEIPR